MPPATRRAWIAARAGRAMPSPARPANRERVRQERPRFGDRDVSGTGRARHLPTGAPGPAPPVGAAPPACNRRISATARSSAVSVPESLAP
ncbi:MAG: hypothetical protein ACK52I_21770 [Pseudomonadota bacterium]